MRIDQPFRRPVHAGRQGRVLPGVFLLAAALTFTGCDQFLDVTSPTLAEEHEVDNPQSVAALLRGIEGNYANAAAGIAGNGGLYMAGALLTDEQVHSGVWRGHRGFSDGFSRDNWEETEQMWAAASEARWTAENLIPRIQRLLEQPADAEDALEEQLGNQLAATILWAGFANRLLGDHFCQAVIDRGPLQDHTAFYQRAEQHFTDAITLATELGRDTIRQAAQAGRAQVRMMLGNWDGAVQDAGRVENLLVYNHRHGGFTGREREWNWLLYSTLTFNREATVWGTPFAEWGRRRQGAAVVQQGDPRVLYDQYAAVPLGTDGRRTFWQQRKHTAYAGAVAVARGTEMRLIEAEAALRQGNWQMAIDKINDVRAFRRSAQGGLPVADRTLAVLPNVTATNADQAWALLMRERGLELWLEGRRLPDMRRWAQTPGSVPFQVRRRAGTGAATTDELRNVLEVQDGLCIPVSRQEKQTNPNIAG